jgi:hypothetical protein
MSGTSPSDPFGSPRFSPFALRSFPFWFSTLVSLFWAARFSRYLPITDGWVVMEKWWFPVAALNTVTHEAGHLILGWLGEIPRVAGGTLLQLAFPLACLVQFWRRGSRAGVLFAAWWTGVNMAEISWYVADAKIQALVLITGMSGREGSAHDWNYLLGRLGLLDSSVGLGRLFFFAGVWLMVYPLLIAITATCKRMRPRKP